MKNFMDEDFLLDTDCAKKLYHSFAAPLPILDYHCHIDPKDIAENRQFQTITKLWLSGDHYKWRQMRSNGVEERYITGDASDWEKFLKWAETLEKLIGNPLYHWSHLELKRYFHYEGCLNKETAKEVWELCNEALKAPEMSAQGLIRQSGVALICTTDDPADSLKWHDVIKNDHSFDTVVLPAWRPDKAMQAEEKGFADYVKRLEEASGCAIRSFEDMKEAMRKRMKYFHERGCRISDHGLSYVMHTPASPKELEAIFQKALTGNSLTFEEAAKYKSEFLLFLGREYHRLGWAMQLHYGCIRNNNRAMFSALGPDTGFDAIGNNAPASQLAGFLNQLAQKGELPKTILYSLNPADNAVIGAMIGCFQDASAAGKMQQGCAWWFNDHKTGITEQLTSLANLGTLGNFIGMLTDSRSFLSYTRHEYFRRILCSLIGGWVENGEYPYHEAALKKIIQGICYDNAAAYFGFARSAHPHEHFFPS